MLNKHKEILTMNKAEQTKNKYLKSIYSVIQTELKEMIEQAEKKTIHYPK